MRSPCQDLENLPHQGRGRDLPAVIEIFPEFEPAAREIEPGGLLWVLGWFHLARRDLLRVHPKGDATRPVKGVFSLRSPVRPNPISLTLVEVISVDSLEIRVNGLELLDGTPILDLKPYVPDIDR